MTTVNRGAPATLLVEWREYAGGPMSNVLDVAIGIVNLFTGAIILAPTSTGVTNPATGLNAYVWTSDPALAVGQYLVSWTGTDPDSELVTASEVVEVTAGGELGGPYATRATLKRRMGIPDSTTSQDVDVDRALSSASSAINLVTGRQFGRANVVSARQFYAGRSGIDVDDIYDLAGLTVDGNALAVDTWTAEPLNGIKNGVYGWPTERLSSRYGTHPIYQFAQWPGRLVTVEALWGWAEVPADIEQACLMLAADQLKSADAPFGVAGFGDYVVRVRANPKVAELLNPYVREIVKVGA